MWRSEVKKTWSLSSFSKWSKGGFGRDSGRRRLPRDLDKVLGEMTQPMFGEHQAPSPLGTSTEPNRISSFD